jgi:phosphate-selective porin OprO/OprP
MKKIVAHQNSHFQRHPIRLSAWMTLFLSVSLLGLWPHPLFAASADELRLQKLEAAVSALQKENATLKKELGTLRDKTAALNAKTAGAASGTDDKPKPINVVAAGKEYKLVLGGFIQAQLEGGDGPAYQGRWSDSISGIDNRIRVRRARLNITGDFLEKFDFKLEGDFTLNDANSTRTSFGATDIFINWHEYPEANVKTGQFKAPFGLEQLTSDTKSLTIERSLVTEALTPERQIGIQLWGKPLANRSKDYKDLITYYLGIFNGNGRNTNINDNNEFMFAGRLELLPYSGKLWERDTSIMLGVNAYSRRVDPGTNISPAGNLRVNRDGSLSAFTLSDPDERNAFGADLSFRFDRFNLTAEYITANIRPRNDEDVKPTFEAFDSQGYYVQAAYFLIPKKLQFVTKWEQFNPGQRLDDDIQSITGGLNYYINGDDLKIMANYIHSWSEFRKNNPDLGDDQFDTFFVRLQLMF